MNATKLATGYINLDVPERLQAFSSPLFSWFCQENKTHIQHMHITLKKPHFLDPYETMPLNNTCNPSILSILSS